MGADDLLKQDYLQAGAGQEAPGFGAESEFEEDGWYRAQDEKKGADQDLHRSSQAAALSELLLESGLQKKSVDALLLGDDYSQLFSDKAGDGSAVPPALPLNRSLIVIDQSAENWRTSSHAPADAEVLVLEQTQDGLAQISDYLHQQRTEGSGRFSNLAIVCRGMGGQLKLGDREVEASELVNHETRLNGWQESLETSAGVRIFNSVNDSDGTTIAVQDALNSHIGTEAIEADASVAEEDHSVSDHIRIDHLTKTTKAEINLKVPSNFPEHFRLLVKKQPH